MRLVSLLFGCCCLLLSHLVVAGPDQSCKTVRFGLIDWTDVQVTTAIARHLLTQLGYDVKVSEESVDTIFKRIEDNQLDVFLGNWMPAQTQVIGPFLDKGSVKTIATNLGKAKYTLAVPEYVYQQGIHSFADLAEYADRFGQRIYGLEKGNDGNHLVQQMITNNHFGLKNFKLIETSERLMLAQVKGKVKRGEWIVFLAWEPHPMNQTYQIEYLAGGDDFFGPNFGQSTVHTNIRKDLISDCPNLGQFLTNLTFSLDMEEHIMDQVINGFVPVGRAVELWLKDNPQQVNQWMAGVTTANGKPLEHSQAGSSIAAK
jgi:glycine betaine/proline transport system substrate-binding protein